MKKKAGEKKTKVTTSDQIMSDIPNDISSLSSSMDTLSKICKDFWQSYSKETPKKIKLIDWFCLCCFLIAIIEIGYMLVIRSSFPFNAFLSSIFTPIGTAIITSQFLNFIQYLIVCFRLQVNPDTKYLNITFERSVWEYLFAILTLFLATVLFVG